METELILGLATIGIVGMGFILKIGTYRDWPKELKESSRR